MKLLMMMYTGSNPERVVAVLEAHDAGAFTEIDHAHGRGTTGRSEGTRAWPGESSIFFSIVANEQVAGLEDALHGLASGAVPGERLHVAVLPVEHYF